MGKLLYGNLKTEIALDDRVLAHLQVIVTTKLRRGEGFFLNWKDDPAVGDGRSSAWIGPGVPLFFKFFGGKHIDLNRAWLEQMTVSANSNGGLQLTDEPSITAVSPVSQD